MLRKIVRRIVGLAISASVALMIVVVLRAFVFQLYLVEQASMRNTVQPGAILAVDKLTMNFSPLRRGDIVVFVPPLPADEQTPSPPASSPIMAFLSGRTEYVPFIKRVIGMPGDKVEITAAGDVVLNGKILNEPYVFSENPLSPDGTPLGGDRTPLGNNDGKNSWVVPAGEVFVMGDHRDVSEDSRYFGPIKISEIIGRAYLKVDPPLQIFAPPPWDQTSATDYGEYIAPIPTLEPVPLVTAAP